MSRFVATLASVLFGLLAWPAHLLAKAGVRFVHGIPGEGEAELTVEQEGRTTVVGKAGYASSTRLRAVRSGPISWKLVSAGKTIAEGTGEVGSGPLTAIAMPQGDRPVVKLFKDAAQAPRGQARIRVIHAAGELGAPDVRVNAEPVARRLGFGEATKYFTLRPGRYDLEAVRPGTTDALVGRRGVRVAADSITSAIVIGTGGEPARIITVSDTIDRGREQGAQSTGSSGRQRGGGGDGGESGDASSYVIRRGDSLWSIAAEQLGDGASDARIAHKVEHLWRDNAERIGTGDRNLIFPGQRITLS